MHFKERQEEVLESRRGSRPEDYAAYAYGFQSGHAHGIGEVLDWIRNNIQEPNASLEARAETTNNGGSDNG